MAIPPSQALLDLSVRVGLWAAPLEAHPCRDQKLRLSTGSHQVSSADSQNVGPGHKSSRKGGSCREASAKETPEGSPSAYAHILGCTRKLRANGTCSEEASDELLTNFSKKCLQLDSGKPGAQLCHKQPGKLAADRQGQCTPHPAPMNAMNWATCRQNRTPQRKKKREVFLKGK